MDLEKIKYNREHVSFTYHICWTKQNLHYYGLRTAKGCHPTDIWTTYFTSSNPVKELRKTIGEPDLIETRRTFKTVEKARDWESNVLRRLKVTQRDDWINKCSFPCCNWTGKKHTKESRKKISKSTKGEKHHFYGKHFSKEHKEKISKANKGHEVSESTKLKISKANKGKIRSKEMKEKMSKSLSGKKNPNYGKKGKNSPNYGRKHSEKSKEKMSISAKGRSDKTRNKMSEASRKRKRDKNGRFK